jgi:hypothetical protein
MSLITQFILIFIKIFQKLRFTCNKNQMGKKNKELEEATAFALKYCNPEDSDVISDLDRHTRETAWALLQRIKHLESQKCVCEECGSEVEDEEVEDTVVEETEKAEEVKTQEIKAETPDTSTLDKLSEIAENNKELIKKATKTVAGAGAVAATTQTAAAATSPSITAATATFFQEASQKVAAIGTAGVMSIGSGAYFQAKTVKAEGIEIAVVSEQEYGVFSKFNQFTESTLGVSSFKSVIRYAEEGFGDIEGTGPPSEGEGSESGGEELSNEEQSARFKEAAEKKRELEEKGILPKIEEELGKDKSVTPVGNE